MPSTDAELTLTLKARDLASGVMDDLSGKIKKVGDSSEETGGRFGRLGRAIDAIPFGRFLTMALDIIGRWKPVRDLMEHVGNVIGERLAPVMAKLTAWVDAHLIPALVKLADFVGPILGKAIDVAAWAFEHVIIPAVEAVIGIITTLITKIQDAIHWLQSLNVMQTRTAAMDAAHLAGLPAPGHAAGGWVGLHGPEIALVGERGPEYVVPNNKLGGMLPGYQAVAVSEKDIARMVDERLYFTLRRAAPTSGRV